MVDSPATTRPQSLLTRSGHAKKRRITPTIRAGASPNSKRHKNAAEGWKLKNVTCERVQMEDVFSSRLLSNRARLFCRAAIQRMETELSVRRLNHSRSSHVIVLCSGVLERCATWLNERIEISARNIPRLTAAYMYRFLAVFMFSQCTGFSFDKTLSFLSKLDCSVPTLDNIRFISNNILAFSATGRCDIGEYVWDSQRDQTVRLTEFESLAYRMSSSVFFPYYTFGTLDDDLYGTRASDNQLKMLSNRKADKEGHCVGAVADALFRINLMVRFRRRGDSQNHNDEKLLVALMEARGEQSLTGFVLTADRGYGKLSMIPGFIRKGIGFIFIMPEHLLRCHPFVVSSHFIADRADQEEESVEVSTDQVFSTNSCGNDGQSSKYNSDTYDRDRSFRIDDSPCKAPCSNYAEKLFHGKASHTRQTVTAVAIIERGNNKYQIFKTTKVCVLPTRSAVKSFKDAGSNSKKRDSPKLVVQ